MYIATLYSNIALATFAANPDDTTTNNNIDAATDTNNNADAATCPATYTFRNMTDNFPTGFTREYNEDFDIFTGFQLPKTHSTIVKSCWVRADIGEPLSKTTKLSI